MLDVYTCVLLFQRQETRPEPIAIAIPNTKNKASKIINNIDIVSPF